MSQWISVKDRLPDVWSSALVAMVTKRTPWDTNYEPAGFCVAYLHRGSGVSTYFKSDMDGRTLQVTHWMPLPEPPEVEIV